MFRIVAVAATLALCTGCTIPAALLAIDALDRDRDIDQLDIDMEESNAVGTMRGAMPEAGAFDSELQRAAVWWHGDNGVDFDLHVVDSSWAMLGGGFEVDLDDGETLVLEPDEHWVFGCSGPEEWDAQFDRPAETVEIHKEIVDIDGQAMVELTVIASFGEDGEVTAVVVQPAPNPED